MRMARIKIQDRAAVYHCISRVVGGQWLLGDGHKEVLRQMMWQQAQFCGLQIITYCLLSNHFHILVRVPAPVEEEESLLVERASAFYGPKSLYVVELRQSLEQLGHLSEEQSRELRGRMGDVSVFMKELKQRFSRWFNRREGRFGTLWAERFKSVLVEDVPGTVETVAGYVDLNPLRAGLVKDPKEYRWCGYGEALGGNALAQEGLGSFFREGTWEQGAGRYREMLLVRSGWAGRSGKVALEAGEIREALKREGKLALGQVLRLRVRYFTDGVVLGSSHYVNEVFGQYRDRFGKRRRSGARKLRGLGPLGGLRSLRDLRLWRVA